MGHFDHNSYDRIEPIGLEIPPAPVERTVAPPAAPQQRTFRLVDYVGPRLRYGIGMAVAMVLLAAGGISVALVSYTITFPNPMALRKQAKPSVIRVVDIDGNVLTERGQAYDYVPIDLLPRHVTNAVVATEDRRFFEHWGLDPSGLARAAFANLRAGRYAQGGSTLTQQLAKNLFLSSERRMGRKFEELLLALWLEVRLSKQDILELYLNRVYFGGGAYGIEAAARRYFDKSAQTLTLPEAAVLAGLLKAPSKYSPASSPQLARARARSVLQKMTAANLLTPDEEKAAAAGAIGFHDAKNSRDAAGVEYAIDFILDRLPQLPGSDDRDIIVETTIDARLQKHAQATVSRHMIMEGGAAQADQAGLVLLDTSGAIRALVGGRSYAESQYNRAVKARRQPGSAFKPFVYLAALENGATPDTTVFDLPVAINGWSPRNESGMHQGAMSLRQGLAQSVNAVAVRLYVDNGPRRTIEAARRLGIRSELREGPSLALGTSEVSLLEMTGAYAVFANGGFATEPHIIRKVTTSSGRVVYQRGEQAPVRLVAPAHVGAMNDMLNAALVSGTGRRAALLRHPAAGKTGTSQDHRDAWFIGYTQHYVAGAWVGNDSGGAMNRVMGGTLPARLWRDVMVLANEGRPPMPLPGTAALPPPALPVPPQPPPRMPSERIDHSFLSRVLTPPQPQPAVNVPAVNVPAGITPAAKPAAPLPVPLSAPDAAKVQPAWAGFDSGRFRQAFEEIRRERRTPPDGMMALGVKN